MSDFYQDRHDPVETAYPASVPRRYAGNYPPYTVRNGLIEPADREIAGEDADPWQFYLFSLMLDQLTKEAVSGDVAQFGAGWDYSTTILARLARKQSGRLYLLVPAAAPRIDPLPGGKPRHFEENSRSGEGVARSETLDEFADTYAAFEGVDIVTGMLSATGDDARDDVKLAAAYIVCRDYLPFKTALEYAWSHLVPGGYLLMPGYANSSWNSCEKAVDEFFADKREAILPLPDAIGTAVVRKGRFGGARSNWLVHPHAVQSEDCWIGPNEGNLQPFLLEGWEAPEDAGVPGIGRSHQLRIYRFEEPEGDIELSTDVSAVLIGSRTKQTVLVMVAKQRIASWRFDVGRNRNVRTVRIPRELLRRESSSYVVDITFQPADVRDAAKLGIASSDRRERGMVLHRFRQRELCRGSEDEWVDIGTGAGAESLLSGWSAAETWGSWGVGIDHLLEIQLGSRRATERVFLDIDALASVKGKRPKMHVDVVIGGCVIDRWEFSAEKEAGMFSIEVPSAARVSNDLIVEFRPWPLASPRDMDPRIEDDRLIGLGLKRFRLRRAATEGE